MAHVLLSQTEHRPWPLPERSWVMRMSWQDLLFMHWPMKPAELQAHIPAGLELDLFDGEAWIGIVPFRMARTTLRFLPTLPGVSEFCELNVRTYVRHGDHRGVWFLSLDAASWLSVRLARSWFHLPYFDARMSCESTGQDVRYVSSRTHRGAPAAEFDARYGPRGEVYRSRTGTLEHWLTERYSLYSADDAGRVFEGEVHHEPWRLQSAEAEVERNTYAEAHGLALPDCEPLLHFARRIDTVAWAPR